ALIDATGKDVNHGVVVAVVNEERERERVLPEGVDRVFHDVDALFASDRVVLERVTVLARFACQAVTDGIPRQRGLLQRAIQTKGENRVDEPVRVPDADVPASGEVPDLKGIVRDDMNVLDEADRGQPPRELRVQLLELAFEEVLPALARVEEVLRRGHDADAD